jgi:hypothetical protein
MLSILLCECTATSHTVNCPGHCQSCPIGIPLWRFKHFCNCPVIFAFNMSKYMLAIFSCQSCRTKFSILPDEKLQAGLKMWLTPWICFRFEGLCVNFLVSVTFCCAMFLKVLGFQLLLVWLYHHLRACLI